MYCCVLSNRGSEKSGVCTVQKNIFFLSVGLPEAKDYRFGLSSSGVVGALETARAVDQLPCLLLRKISESSYR